MRIMAHCRTNLEDLSAFHRKAKYTPIDCDQCHITRWSHGFRARYLENRKIILKRLRCRECKTVVTVKPADMPRFFQSLFSTIIEVLSHRLAHHVWPKTVTRQKSGHWLRAFVRAHKHHAISADPAEFLSELFKMGVDNFDKIMRN
jgi:hypothetical protein